jgi:hypothetical protein
MASFSPAQDPQIQEILNKLNAVIDEFLPIGLPLEWPWKDLPPGRWLWLDDRTIGDSSSGATGRANDDILVLYTKIWTDYNNTTAPIYTSSGGASTRGTSVKVDWEDHKRISLPKRQGRIIVAMDDYGNGGSSANQITAVWADTLGSVFGEEKHSLTASENGPHTHGLPRGDQDYANGTKSSVWGQTYGGLATGTSGSGTAHNNVQPSVTTKYIIRY